MGVYRVEPAEGDLAAACSCCVGEPGLRGFVYEDEAPRAVYFVEPLGVPKHPLAKLGLALGEWAPGSPNTKRIAFAFTCKPSETGVLLTPSAPKMLMFPELAMLGLPLQPAALAAHADLAVFHALARAVIEQDWRLAPIRRLGDSTPRRFSAEAT